jgi:hypothetical protein
VFLSHATTQLDYTEFCDALQWILTNKSVIKSEKISGSLSENRMFMAAFFAIDTMVAICYEGCQSLLFFLSRLS